MTFLAITAMALALFLIPLGAPGLWIMIGILAIGAISQTVGVLTLLAAIGLAVGAELLEFVFVRRYTTRYGGSRKAFWAALAGGIIGVILGTPVPVIGSIIGAFVGSFIGAALVTYAETKNSAMAGRVGWGVTLGRAVAAVVKTFAGLVLLVIGAFAFLA